MEHTPFAGLTALDENDPITIDGASFLIKNPRITDHLLQIGAVTHRHDQHGILPNPHVGPTAQVIPSAGTIAASTTLAFTYTVADNAGGETAPAPPVVFVTGGQVNPPTIQPSAQVINGSGIMPAGNYYYGLTYTDGDGGETSLGPPILVSILPGNASASVLLGGLASELHANGPVDWRLWRSYEGADWHLVTQGSANTFLDDGFDPPDDPARPPDGNTTMGTFSVAVTIPALDPAFATGTAINLYLAPDTTFSDPCFLMQVPIASAGHTILITDESVTQGSPPAVTTCVPGAHQIYPDTELVWGVKSPVANSDALPASATIGDVRLALDTDILWGYTPQGWVELGAAGTWKSPVVAPSALPISVLNRDGDARVTTSTDQIWLWNKGAGFDLDYVPLDAIENQVTDGNPNPLGNVGSGWVTDTATDSQYIYWTWSEFSWTGSGRIGRVRLDGTGADPFWVHQNNASGITNPGGLDDDATYVYYANDRSVGRVNKDGTGLNSFFVVSTEFNGGVVGVAVDDTYLYIATFSNGIWRCNKSDGSNLIALHHAPAQPPGLPASIDTFHVTDIAVDDTYVYWSMQFEMTDPGVGGSGLVFSDAGIGRCHKDGTNVQSPWVTTAEGDKGGFPMTVETVDGAVYFGHGHYTDRYGSFLPAIGVVNPDGSGLKIDALTAPVGSGSLTALSFGAGDFFFALTHINEPQRQQAGIDGISSYALGDWVLCNCAGGGSGGVGTTSFVASAGNASANVGPFLGFAASGDATVQLVASGGSAVVVISASGLQGAPGTPGTPGTPGAPGPSVGVGGSGQVPLIDPASYVEFVASGGAVVGVTALGGGSARVSITTTGGGGGGSSATSLTVAASGGASAVSPDSYLEFAASGGLGVAVASTGVGSARVLLAPPPPAVGRVGAGQGRYEIYVAAKFPYAYHQNVDGSLTLDQTGAALGGNQAFRITVSPDGQTIYIANGSSGSNNLVVYRRNPDNTLTLIQTLSQAGSINDIACSPDGQFVYVGSTILTVYKRGADGKLTATGVTYDFGSSQLALAIAPNGQFMYVWDGVGHLTSMARNVLSGELRQLNLITGLPLAGGGAKNLIVSPDGRNLYIAGAGGAPEGVYQFSVDNGATLTLIGTVTTSDADGIVISPDGRDVYVQMYSTHNIAHYSRDLTTGVLTFVANTTITNFADKLAITPDGRFVYAAVVSNQGVVTMSRAGDGSLTVVQQLAPNDGANFAGITVAPSLGALQTTDLEFVGSAGIGVTVASGSVPGGSAQVVISLADGGVVTLSGGTATVNDAAVGANHRIILTAQDNNTTGALRVSARTPGTSFTITSSNAGDSGVVAYQLLGTP